MNDSRPTPTDLGSLFEDQRFAALATVEEDGRPYANLMAFAVSPDLRSIVLVTGRSTRKHDNLRANPQVALLIDNRLRGASDVREAMAVTVLGHAQEARGERRERLLAFYVAKHPYLEEFARSPSSAVFEVAVDSYYVVRRFQEVTELHVRP